MRNIIKKLGSAGRSGKGQSLVEMAIAAPLLIFMMIGVFEVGWALRGYLVLVNVNREITRFAVRPGYMDFSSQERIGESWNRIRDWVDTTLSEQLDMRFDGEDPNSTLIISHIVVDPGQPCKDAKTDAGCEPCSQFNENNPAHNPFPHDDIIIHPGLDTFAYQTFTFGITGTTTRINYEELVSETIIKNNQANCDVIKKGGVPSASNMIVTELFYEQPQLFGFPFISNPLTDPIPMYSHTVMRLAQGSRSIGINNLTEGISTLGPVCFAYPLLVDVLTPPVNGQQVNLLANGWLKWNNGTSLPDQEYLENSLQFPQMSLADFVDASGSGELLSADSEVHKMAGGTLPDEALIQSLVGRPLIVPTSTSAGNNPVPVDGFVWVTIPNEAAIDLSTGTISGIIDLTTPLPAPCQASTEL